ncbi:hypothetical protein [Flavobacterium hercynium]|uniref:Uncharacterized protein n=1 Tax=Flavobacterium hercynium TaxID=387094 RepID=A0A226HJK2_9FLAO|nr:hypothetical protein [Flavobacterium hercynium]OXA94355.1 hypothetical protein B0A66_04680 [Flavobacterium hercynium]SMP29128.1 hypothetical protein SAMN06265346_11224 [Flavobacterium hercynium]
MPNLFNPTKFSMFTFFNEVREKNAEFKKYNSQIKVSSDSSLFCTDLDEDVIFLKIATSNNTNEIWGTMKLSYLLISNHSYYVVEKIATAEKYRKQGIAKILYSFAVELELNIMSDSTQTSFGSKEIWSKFSIYFPNKNVYIINTKTLSKRKFITQPEQNIWGKQSDEDFDLLENDDKLYLIHEMFLSNAITKAQELFFMNNLKVLSDKHHIRLTLE